MTSRLILLITLLLCGAFCHSVAAHDKPYRALPANIVPLLLTTPEKPESETLKKETLSIIHMQINPDKKEILRANEERDPKPEMIATPVDSTLTRANYPMLFVLLDHAGDAAGQAIGDAKHHWHTQRPYLSDHRIKPLIEAHESGAYPSGHTVLGHVWAAILGMVFPDKKQHFREQAEKMAQHRVLVGMHYPQDVRGGQELALLVLGHMLADAAFIRDLDLAQSEAAKK